ncbi:MAG: hypothetical protein Q9181_000247 [Wetmoreana brouardii]
MASQPESWEPFLLFGGTKSWLPPPWDTSDDRIRGGRSSSSLSALSNDCALFEGHLDIETLGGAGFASQFQTAAAAKGKVDVASDSIWNLYPYSGVEIDVRAGDGKVYTLIVRDEKPQDKREDGRERAGVNWEAEFRASESGEVGGKKVWIPWSAFKATYRGKEKEDTGKLKTGEIRRVGFMMRSYFGMQQGDFRLELRSISARTHSSEFAGRPSV